MILNAKLLHVVNCCTQIDASVNFILIYTRVSNGVIYLFIYLFIYL